MDRSLVKRCSRWVSIGTLALTVTACSTLGISDTPKSRTIERKGIDVVLDHSVGVGIVFKDEKTQERMCRTPGPDFASGEGGGVNLALPNSGQVGFSDNFNALALGGRAPGVLALRELMYRACELTLNTNANPTEALAIYKYFITQSINASRAMAAAPGSQALTLVGQPPAMTPADTSGAGAAYDPNGAATYGAPTYGTGNAPGTSSGTSTATSGNSYSPVAPFSPTPTPTSPTGN